MKPFLFFTLVVFALSFSSPVAYGQTQVELNDEAAKKLKTADEALNATYQKLMAMLDDAAKAKLKASEREWIRFRDAEREFEADGYRGGSIMPLIYYECATKLTRLRTAQLTEHIHDRQGH